MGERELVYVNRYREQTALRAKIEAAIGDLKAVCEAAGNWRKAADDLAAIPMTLPGSPWAEERLRNLLGLKALLVQYGAHKGQVASAWAAMNDAERVGLAPPSSLDS